MKGFVDQTKQLVNNLSGGANISDPEKLPTFFFYRAIGKSDKEIADIIGVNRKTLRNWDGELHENLSQKDYNKLVVNSVALEQAKREEEEEKKESDQE